MLIACLLIALIAVLAYFMFRGLFVDDSGGYWTYR